MPKKYHIKIRPRPNRFFPPGKYTIIEQDQYCLHCPTNACVKKDCPYDVYKERGFDPIQLRDTIDYLCKGCLRCIQECKANAISRAANPAYLNLGDEYYKPEIITSTWSQAETGKVPVSGAGYGGPFTGQGFDSMWTDMSEIVRPTRDGIHGREYIATNIDLGRKLTHLEFDKDGRLLSDLPPLLELPIPIIFNLLPFGPIDNNNILLAMAEAAKTLDTLMIVKAEDITRIPIPYKDHLIPLIDEPDEKTADFRMVEFIDNGNPLELIEKAKRINPDLITSIRIKAGKDAASRVLGLAKQGAEVIHICADSHGMEFSNTEPRFIKEVIRDLHVALVNESLRDKVSLVFSGGIALSEHLAKAIICGADCLAIDIPLLISLECRVCKDCQDSLPCPVEIDKIKPDWGTGRIVNLIGAWHSQLIEVMGAMGIREVRRMRGEIGRAMFFEELEEILR